MSGEKKSFGRFIAGVVAASLVCGTMIGVGIGIAKPLVFDKTDVAFEEDTTESKEVFSFDNLNNSDVQYKQVQYVPTMSTAEIQKKVSPSIVYIECTVESKDYFNRIFESTGSGSGIIYKKTDDKYYIVTNNHVIEEANKITITFDGGQIVEATLVGGDSQNDLAVLKVNISDLSDETKNTIDVAEFGDSDKLEVGEVAIAIGNPLGSEFENSVTQGIISALNRQIEAYDENLKVIQTDAAINQGNSGGALVDSKGQVIGINSAKISGAEGMGFAIPSNTAIPIFEDLIANGSVKKAQLGIMGKDVTQDIGAIYTLPIGVYVAEVIDGGPAQKAGIVATDIITDFNGEKIFSMKQLSELIKESKVGDTVNIRLVRDGKTPLELQVTLEAEQ